MSKYSPLSQHEDYDWAIEPFEEYRHGLVSADLAPMIGTPKLQSAIERYNFGPPFSRALKTSPGELPDGQWKAALATRIDRNIYILSVETSAADDAVIIAAFNAAPNKSRFNFFYRNCSTQAKAIFALIMPQIDTIGDRTSGITMETPKGLAKALVDQALENPELNLRIRTICADPGTFGRSRDAGLSRSQVLAGDPRVALLVLAAIIDYNLYESAGHRDDIEYVHGMFALFRQASDTISRQAGGG